MTDDRPPQISAHHLQRLAVTYRRQSTPQQVQEHEGSSGHHRGQREYARRWGWPETAIVAIEDLGVSGTMADRAGFHRLLRMVERGEVGIILVSDPSRLSRSSRALASLVALCRTTHTLVAVEGVITEFQ